MKDGQFKIKLIFALSTLFIVGFVMFGVHVLRVNDTFTISHVMRLVSYPILKLEYSFRSDRYVASVHNASSNFLSANASTTMARDIPVLLYHGITSTPGRFNMTQSLFKSHMFALKEAGYKTITLSDFKAFVDGKKELPAKSFLLTFDDARYDSFTGADPVLNAVGFNAVMFVPTQATLFKKNDTSGYYLGKSALHEMILSGRWELGSHAKQEFGDYIPVDANGTKAPFLSNKMWLKTENRLETDVEYENRVNRELLLAKTELENEFGRAVVALAYPSSDYGQQSINNSNLAEDVINRAMVKNYDIAFEQVWPDESTFTSNYVGLKNLHLKRVEPSNNLSADKLLAYLGNAESKNSSFAVDFSNDQGWKSSWGSINSGRNSLTLSASTTGTGASAILDGSYMWKDYGFVSAINSDEKNHVTLIARYMNGDNYAACTFSTTTVRIDERLEGKTKTLSSIANPLILDMKNVHLGLKVSGRNLYCYAGDEPIVNAGLSAVLDHGGIGLQVWNKDRQQARAEATSLSVGDLAEFKNLIKESPRYALKQRPPRPIALGNASSSDVIASVASKENDFALPYRLNTADLLAIATSTKENNIGAWYALPNKLVVTPTGLTLGTVMPYRTAFAVMQGGYAMSDYRFNANLELGISSKIATIARYKNSNNYVTCEYTNIANWAQLIEVRDGKKYYISGNWLNPGSAELDKTPNKTLSMEVSGQQSSCFINNKAVVTAVIPTMPLKGTVGLRVYADAPGLASLTVKNAEVLPVPIGEGVASVR